MSIRFGFERPSYVNADAFHGDAFRAYTVWIAGRHVVDVDRRLVDLDFVGSAVAA